MARSPSADRYREDAARFRQRAAAVTSDDRLRDSYLTLAAEYEKLAALLEPTDRRADHPPTSEAEPRSRLAKLFRLGKILVQMMRTLLRDDRASSRARRRSRLR